MASDWDKIPSIPNLEVDWDYEPESALGNRSWKRLVKQDLNRMLGVRDTPVKLMVNDTEILGSLLDVSQGGVGVLLKQPMAVGALNKIGFFLGKETIISKVTTMYSTAWEDRHRIGMQFVGLAENSQGAIEQLVVSGGFDRL